MQIIRNAVVQCCKSLYQTIGNRRIDERRALSGAVRASWKSRYGELLTFACDAVNVSPSGLAVMSTEPAVLSADAFVYSSAHRVKTFAEVRYCRRLETGRYQIGFRFRSEPKSWVGF